MFPQIQEYFTRMQCKHCNRPFTEDAVYMLKQDKYVTVVRIVCSHCKVPLGTAIISGKDIRFPTRTKSKPEGPPAITKDEVLDAHEFFKNLEGDWMKYLPKKERGDVTNA